MWGDVVKTQNLLYNFCTSMSLLSRLLPSVTSPPLPDFRPLYARRFRQMARVICRCAVGRIQVFAPAESALKEAPKIVLYANHPSVWDPLLLALLTGRMWPGHAVVAPIDEVALRRHWYFHGLGFYGLRKSSLDGLRRFLEVTQAALERPAPCIVALTPEGRFTPSGEPIRLQRGLARALLGCRGQNIQVVPVALAYGKGRRGAKIYLGPALNCSTLDDGSGLPELHTELTRRLQDAVDRLHLGRVLESPSTLEFSLC